MGLSASVSVQMIRTDDVRLSTEAFGDTSDPVILLMLGAMASSVWWPDDFCRCLASRGRCVIRYDQRDTGGSTSYSPGTINYTVEDLATDAVAILDGYRVDRAHLVGMSLGGYLAQFVALKYPGRVITLTLIASERLADADPNLPQMSPEILAYHAAAASLDWRDRDAVLDYQVGAWRLLSGSAHGSMRHISDRLQPRTSLALPTRSRP
jgi:pimeloyl-ACP methyl ester carboxylesterase